MILETLIPALSFGLSAAVIPGPLIAYIVNTTLTNGWRKGLLVVLAPLISDVPIIILMTFILGQLPSEVLKVIQMGGGVLLLSIAWGAWKQNRSQSDMRMAEEPADVPRLSGRRVFITGVMMNFLSPGPYLFRASVTGPLLLAALDISLGHALVFLGAFYGVFLSGLSGWVLLFHHARRVDVVILRYIVLATVLLLLWFGIDFITAALGLSEYHPLLLALIIAVTLIQRAWKSRRQ